MLVRQVFQRNRYRDRKRNGPDRGGPPGPKRMNHISGEARGALERNIGCSQETLSRKKNAQCGGGFWAGSLSIWRV